MKILNLPLRSDGNRIKDGENKTIAYTDFVSRAGLMDARAESIAQTVNSAAEMRQALAEIGSYIEAFVSQERSAMVPYDVRRMSAIVETCNRLTAPTREEFDALK